jgi:hypothetical protein
MSRASKLRIVSLPNPASDGSHPSAKCPVTREIGTAELIGKPFIGVVAGSPNTLDNGKPIYPQPSVADRTYVGNMRTYFPQFATHDNLNGTGTISDGSVGVLMVDAMEATIAKYHDFTSSLLTKFTRTYANLNDGLQPAVTSFAPSCKTGSDATIWGFWHYNPNPTSSKPTLYMVPSSGPQWVTNTWLGLGKCYLTQIATRLFSHG